MATGVLTVEADSFLKAGHPHQVMSGALHYFRVRPELWADRLGRLRAMGLNTVETYVAWNVHEQRRGAHDFSAANDLPRFVELAGEAGLDVIIRPGPYICAEWDFGGFPAWLLGDGVLPGGPGTLRTHDSAYLAAVDAWFDVLMARILPQLSTYGGPIVAMQVENEYGSFGDDARYLEYLRAGLRRRGVDVLLLTSDGPQPDMLASGSVPGVLATANFGSRVAESFAVLRNAQPDGPLMCMEYWNGWFDHWGEAHHTRDTTDAARVLDEMLAQGASVNLYLAHGGTNFGLWSGANEADGQHQPTVTSYDYDSAIGEAGELTPKFHAFRRVIGAHLPLPDLPLPAPPARLAPQTVATTPGPALLECLGRFDAPVQSPMPLTMERLGQDHGLVHYSADVRVPLDGAELSIVGLHDRATVLADHVVVGRLDRNAACQALPLRGTGALVHLDLIVENQGRVNYGTTMGEPKGIGAGVRLGRRWIHGWTSTAIRLAEAEVTALAESAGTATVAGPAFHHATFTVPEPADGFIALPGWGKGFLWLNDFLLGRYWDIGPQVTLYAPAPLWRTGTNRVVVLEMEQPGTDVALRDEPELGPPTSVDLPD